MIKTWIFVAISTILAFSSPIQAKTNIFGTDPNNKQFTVEVGSKVSSVSMKFIPTVGFAWGPRITGLLTENPDSTGAKWDTTYLGIGVEFDIVNIASLLPQVPVNATGFMSINADMNLGQVSASDVNPERKDTRYDIVIPVDIGFDVAMNNHVSLRTTYTVKEITGNEINVPTADWRFGVKVVW
jgi:hypothetical protein